VGTSTKAGTRMDERMHDTLHRLPGLPAHGQAARLNSNAAARRRHLALPIRPPQNRPLRNRPLRHPDGHHGRPPRVLAGWQARIGRFFGRLGQ
jgi:hypothetical protein